jgi:hypothetical protein
MHPEVVSVKFLCRNHQKAFLSGYLWLTHSALFLVLCLRLYHLVFCRACLELVPSLSPYAAKQAFISGHLSPEFLLNLELIKL